MWYDLVKKLHKFPANLFNYTLRMRLIVDLPCQFFLSERHFRYVFKPLFSRFSSTLGLFQLFYLLEETKHCSLCRPAGYQLTIRSKLCFSFSCINVALSLSLSLTMPHIYTQRCQLEIEGFFALILASSMAQYRTPPGKLGVERKN